MRNLLFVTSVVLMFGISGCAEKQSTVELSHAEKTLEKIFNLYDAGHDHLFNETYPYQEGKKVTYLAGEDVLQGKRVAYLWPTSGMFSGVNALLKATGNQKYAQILQEEIIPGLENYYDDKREPFCYQSYIMQAGKSDRFYDDNIWLSIDFCESYQLTGKKEYLQKSIKLWQFIMSGWDDELNGGIYWCEQIKKSKNTCSNAPASVLAFRLFEATRDSSFFHMGSKLYDWTKTNLQDSTDYLYFDNKSLQGKISQAKYTYNSGQMIQAATLLYKFTGEKKYLTEAQNMASSAIKYFTSDFQTAKGKTIHLFKNTGNWFNAILFRGYAELFLIDKNPRYINIFQDNLDHLWNSTQSKEGLFSKEWTGEKEDEYKWLLDQVSLVEIWATLHDLNSQE